MIKNNAARLFCCASLAVLCGGKLWAEEKALSFGRDSTEVFTEPAGQPFSVELPFRNVLKQDVSVAAIATSCGCFTAAVDKRNYLSGEKGVLTLAFNPLASGGEMKRVHITLKNGGSVDLLIRLRLLQELTTKPKIVIWKENEKDEPKEVSIDNSGKEPVRIESVVTSSNDFDVVTRLETGYRDPKIVVTPKANVHGSNCIIYVYCASAECGEKCLSLYAYHF